MAVSSTTYTLAEVLGVTPNDSEIDSEVARISDESLLTEDQVKVAAMKQAGYSHREIASFLGMKVGAVDMRSAEVNQVWRDAQEQDGDAAQATIEFLLPT